MLNIRVSERQFSRQKKGIRISWRRLLLFSLLFTIIALMFIEKGNFSAALKYVLFTKKNIVVYDTYTFAFDESVPSDIRDMVVDGLGELKLGDVNRFEFVEKKSDILLSKNQEEGMIELFSKNFIPVAHLYSLEDDISKDSLKKFNLFMLDSKYEKYLEGQYSVNIEILESKEQLVEKLAESDKNIALVEFDDLDVDMKILDVDSRNFLDDENGSIPISFFAKLDDSEDSFIVDVVKKNVGSTDSKFDRERLVKVNMSGVVAISRGLALKMDSLKSTTYPAEEIGKFLANADLTHVSNEVSFVPGCKVYSGMRFCSRPEYIDVLKKSGVDIVELTGNHNNDFGSKYSKESIKIYTDLGMRYFGGGLDEVDASKILYEEVKGTKIAFMGYNYYDTMLKTLALAGDERSIGTIRLLFKGTVKPEKQGDNTHPVAATGRMTYISRIFTVSHCIGGVAELSSAKWLIMEATTFPALVVPDVPYDIDAMLMNPTSIRLEEDIRNPDVIIDSIINHLKEKEADATWLFAVKEFSHADKVAWIESLPDAKTGLQAADIFIVPVTMYITVMVKVAETLGGESLYEKKVLEMNLEKCLPG